MVGNLASYTRLDVLRTFLFLKEGDSRNTLSERLSVGEGSMRSILDTLKEQGLVISEQTGHGLTPKGKTLKRDIETHLVLKHDVDARFFPELKNTALQLKSEKKIPLNIFTRDLAIKGGADHCLILEAEGNSLILSFDTENHTFPELEKAFTLTDQDVIIVTFSERQRWSDIAALAVSEELSEALAHVLKKHF